MKTTVFLTGATGVMGFSGLTELLRYPEKYHIRVLARPSKKNKQLLAPYMGQLDIIWGNLTRYEDVLRGVAGSDIVLHVGGMVSPAADYRPQTTLVTNILAALNVRRAVLEQPIDRQPKVVYIGSVAQMGDRREPLHFGRAGDPIAVSPYDHYGITKAVAERILTDSPIRRWVSLRQSGILHSGILNNFDPIMFHVPINGVLEWATVEDSGRLLERVCRSEVPDEFWCNYYNISSGADYRLTNYRFEQLLLRAIGCPEPEKMFETRWFATRNFHGMYYLDSDRLEDYLHFRANIPVKDYFERLSRSSKIPFFIRIAAKTRIAKLFPHVVKAVMRHVANTPIHGTQRWIKDVLSADDNTRRKALQRIAAYYGSVENYKAIPDWNRFGAGEVKNQAVVLSHGYDESKPAAELGIDDMRAAAEYRGGRCLSKTMQKGDLTTPLEWQCASGHTFKASPRLILLGGHWCPECFPYPYKNGDIEGLAQTGIPTYHRPWQWDKEARLNPFFGSLWLPLHGKEENNIYSADIFNGWEK